MTTIRLTRATTAYTVVRASQTQTSHLPTTGDPLDHVTRNMDARRAAINVTITQLEAASGMKRQQFYAVTNRPEHSVMRTLQKVSMLLYCPLSALMSNDPADAARYPLPPATYLATIQRNRERFGFGDGPAISWPEFVAAVQADADDGAALKAIADSPTG